MTAAEALSRTILLMRSGVDPNIPDEVLLEALLGTEVALVADSENLQSAEGQHALTTAVGLIARSGAQCYLDCPDVPVRGTGAPLRGERLAEALFDLGADLVPGRRIIPELPRHPVDIAVILGDTDREVRARQVYRISGDAWIGRIGSSGERWQEWASPFGALAAAGLAAGEAYKVAMRKVQIHAARQDIFEELFGPVMTAEVALAPPGTPAPSPDLGSFDFVSGGAITQAALYALARIPEVQGQARVIEPEKSDLTNLNRYQLLRRSRVGLSKADDLATLTLGGIRITGVPVRYEDRYLEEIGPLAPSVLVGVDHVPSRWAVQQAHPEWLGIGATADYLAVITYHLPGLTCARCLHMAGPEARAPIPTVSFVSHWAGLWLASLFARKMTVSERDPDPQLTQMATLRPDLDSIWRTPGMPSQGCECRSNGLESSRLSPASCGLPPAA